MVSALPDRPHGMDDHRCRQPSSARRYGLAGLAPALARYDRAAIFEDGGAAPSMNRTVDPAPTEQGRIGGIDDSVDGLGRNVATDKLDSRGSDEPHVGADECSSVRCAMRRRLASTITR